MNQYDHNEYDWQGNPGQTQKKYKRMKYFAGTAVIALLITLALLASSIGAVLDPASIFGQVTASESSSFTPGTDDPEPIKVGTSTEAYTDLTALYDKVKGSCASVLTEQALGSAFLVRDDGYLITNHHVIEDAKKIRVVFYDGTEYEAALVGSDSVRDIAVLKIEGENFVPLEVGVSKDVKIGEQVVAVGTPYSINLAGTMNLGIISGITREVEVSNDAGSIIKTMSLLQTDTSINPGNSGGPLINMRGQVIGINTLKLMNEYEGLGFAIPIDNAVAIANMLITHGKVVEDPENDFVSASPKLHITVMNVDVAVEKYNIRTDITLPQGVFIDNIAPSSAMYKAGANSYDIITKFGDKEIANTNDLTLELKKYKAGQMITVELYRMGRNNSAGNTFTIEFQLDSAN